LQLDETVPLKTGAGTDALPFLASIGRRSMPFAANTPVELPRYAYGRKRFDRASIIWENARSSKNVES
jgi:hypothetical protein